MASVVIALPAPSNERATIIASPVVEGAGRPHSSIPFVADVVSAYFSARDNEMQEELFRDVVRKFFTDEGVQICDAAFSRGDDVIVEDVIWALQAALATPPSTKGKKEARKLDPSNVGQHNAVRFLCYKKLMERFGYGGGKRVPLPILAEILVKAAFPGAPSEGSFEFTGIIASSIAKTKNDYETRTKDDGGDGGSASESRDVVAGSMRTRSAGPE